MEDLMVDVVDFRMEFEREAFLWCHNKHVHLLEIVKVSFEMRKIGMHDNKFSRNFHEWMNEFT